MIVVFSVLDNLKYFAPKKLIGQKREPELIPCHQTYPCKRKSKVDIVRWVFNKELKIKSLINNFWV